MPSPPWPASLVCQWWRRIRHARPAVLRRALSAAVSGFAPKTTPATRLAETIREVAAGRRYVASISDIAAQVHLAQGTVRNYLSAP